MNTKALPVKHRDAEPQESDELRWYCGLALQAMIARHGVPENASAREEIALWAYRMAEQMVRTVRQLDPTSPDRDQP